MGVLFQVLQHVMVHSKAIGKPDRAADWMLDNPREVSALTTHRPHICCIPTTHILHTDHTYAVYQPHICCIQPHTYCILITHILLACWHILAQYCYCILQYYASKQVYTVLSALLSYSEHRRDWLCAAS